MSALEFRLAETLGGTAKPGWSPRKGRRFEFLPRRKPCRNTADQAFLPYNQLKIRSLMPRWWFKCVLLRAKEETLWLAKSDRSSHGATADGSSGFERLGIPRVFRQENCGIERA